MNAQLLNKDKEINELKTEVNAEREKVSKAISENESLERDKKSNDENLAMLKQLLIKAKKDVADAKEHEEEHLLNDAQLKAQVESFNLEIENYKVEINLIFILN